MRRSLVACEADWRVLVVRCFSRFGALWPSRDVAVPARSFRSAAEGAGNVEKGHSHLRAPLRLAIDTARTRRSAVHRGAERGPLEVD